MFCLTLIKMTGARVQALADERRVIEAEEGAVRIASTPRHALRRQALIADEEVKVSNVAGMAAKCSITFPQFPSQTTAASGPNRLCSVLEKSPFGAKSDFEIRAFKGFLYMYKKISPKKGLEVFTPKNLKWKKYIRQSENANGTPLEPLWGSK